MSVCMCEYRCMHMSLVTYTDDSCVLIMFMSAWLYVNVICAYKRIFMRGRHACRYVICSRHGLHMCK